jgi:flagellar basal body-associated protein FliL
MKVPDFKKSQSKFSGNVADPPQHVVITTLMELDTGGWLITDELQARKAAINDAMTKTNIQPFQLSEHKVGYRFLTPLWLT